MGLGVRRGVMAWGLQGEGDGGMVGVFRVEGVSGIFKSLNFARIYFSEISTSQITNPPLLFQNSLFECKISQGFNFANFSTGTGTTKCTPNFELDYFEI